MTQPLLTNFPLIRRIAYGSICLILGSVSAPAQPAQTNAPAATTQAAVGAVPPDVQAALQMPQGPDKVKALTTAANNWAQKDPTSALAWALQLPPDLEAKVAGPVAGACGKAGGKASADLLLQQATPDAWKAMHPLLVNWAVADPSSATAWALQAPSVIRYLAVFSTADGWCRKDAPSAAAWAAKLESADDRRYAIQGVALLWGRGNLDAATPWVQQLKGDDLKTAAQTIAQDWHLNKLTADETKNGLTAKQWLAELSLSDAEQDAILKSPPFPSMYPKDQKPAAKSNP